MIGKIVGESNKRRETKANRKGNRENRRKNMKGERNKNGIIK